MKSHELECPVCGEGHLSTQAVNETIEYKGQTGDVQMLLAVCDLCGVEHAGPEHLRANKRSVVALHKRMDGLLTGREVREVREALDLTQVVAARVFGGGPVAFSKYENDEVSQSESMDRLLRVAKAVPQAFAWLAEYTGLKLSVTRMTPGEVELRKPVSDRSWVWLTSTARGSVLTVSKGEYRTVPNRTQRAVERDHLAILVNCA
ncbi:MAG: hypothetical protein COA41_20900 [Sphingopyxis sp.]|nr:MAG: hypothetical protein COA41_20900 [Sphingopyxis sp.]